MKTKIKKILKTTLKSSIDGGNIDDGSILGGDNAVDKLYDLFVDEVTAVRELDGTILSRPPIEIQDKPTCDVKDCDHPEGWRTHYEGGSSWCRKCWCYVTFGKEGEKKK
jgi:hypothetical protein